MDDRSSKPLKLAPGAIYLIHGNEVRLHVPQIPRRPPEPPADENPGLDINKRQWAEWSAAVVRATESVLAHLRFPFVK